MALKMTNREVNGVSEVTLDGRIVLGEESNARNRSSVHVVPSVYSASMRCECKFLSPNRAN